MVQKQELLNANQYAAKLGIVRSTLHKWVRSGELKKGIHYIELPGGMKRYIYDLNTFCGFTLQSSQQSAASCKRDNTDDALVSLPKGARIRIKVPNGK